MSTLLPAWAEQVRARYLRGESSLFVLHGNVHDTLLVDDQLPSVGDFVAGHLLRNKDTVIRYNVSTGCRFVKSPKPSGNEAISGLEELLAQRAPERVLPVLERLLQTQDNVALVIDYAEMIAPVGDATFFSQQDRMAVVTLQRWSLSAELQQSDNLVLLLTEAPNDLHPKIVSNPRVAAVRVPIPDYGERLRLIQHVNRDLEPEWAERFAAVTAGLKSVQLQSILRPAEPETDGESRLRYIRSLLKRGGGTDERLERRARKLATVTQGMSHDEIRELVGVGETPATQSEEAEYQRVLSLIGRRKREIIERECFGLIEFVEPQHDFSAVGGIEEIKKDLLAVADNIHRGNTRRVPMGMLFTGPMGTGKTFVAEAFVRQSGLTGVKLKNFRSKWVGATESNLDRILNVIQAIGQVIVIIDEGDRSFGSGEGNDSDGGTSSRVIARLKEFMSDTTNRGRVLFILMTNRPDRLDIDIKRAGRLDRKIPFLYAQDAEQIERVVLAQLSRHGVRHEVAFPRDREQSEAMIGYSNADIEAIVLLANEYAHRRFDQAQDSQGNCTLTVDDLRQALADYLPSRDQDMLAYMELLAVFEASNRRMLPERYANLSVDELQQRLAELRLRCGQRR